MSDALKRPPTFHEMVGLIKKLYFDYQEDVLKNTLQERNKSWIRYATLNHLHTNSIDWENEETDNSNCYDKDDTDYWQLKEQPMTEQDAKLQCKIKQAIENALEVLPDNYPNETIHNDYMDFKYCYCEDRKELKRITTKLIAGLLRWQVDNL